jgi:hypothetical protein
MKIQRVHNNVSSVLSTSQTSYNLTHASKIRQNTTRFFFHIPSFVEGGLRLEQRKLYVFVIEAICFRSRRREIICVDCSIIICSSDVTLCTSTLFSLSVITRNVRRDHSGEVVNPNSKGGISYNPTRVYMLIFKVGR